MDITEDLDDAVWQKKPSPGDAAAEGYHQYLISSRHVKESEEGKFTYISHDIDEDKPVQAHLHGARGKRDPLKGLQRLYFKLNDKDEIVAIYDENEDYSVIRKNWINETVLFPAFSEYGFF